MILTEELLKQKFNEFTCKKDLIKFLQINCTKKSGQTINHEILNLIGNFGYTLEDILDITIKQRYKNRLIEEYYKNPKYCEYCGKVIPYEKRFNKCCSQSCGASLSNKEKGARTEQTKLKIVNSLKNNRYLSDKYITYKDAIKQNLLCNSYNITDENILNDTVSLKSIKFHSKDNCIICGKPIIPHFNKIRRLSRGKTCSFECSKELKRINCQLTQERLIKNGTHKGWQSRNILSYPEKFWINVLKNNNIDFIQNKPLKHENSNYFLDFYIEINNRKIDLEIDGKQHKYEDRKESDKIRDEFILSNNIEVYRVEWNEINSEKGSLKMKRKIDDFLNFLK